MEHSLNDTSYLRKLIIENPDLPLLIFCGDGSYTGQFSYEQATVNSVLIDELTIHNDRWMDKDEFKERLYEELSDEEIYENLSDSAFEQMINEMVVPLNLPKQLSFMWGDTI